MDAVSPTSSARRRVIVSLAPSVGLYAIRLIEWVHQAGQGGLIYVAEDERRAEQLVWAMRGLAPNIATDLLSPWDCLPYDSVSPSREVMGKRASVLSRMAQATQEVRLLVTSPASIVQRVPPRRIWSKAKFSLSAGSPFSPSSLESYLHDSGYVLDERVDEPGEAAIRGQVIDLFPADSAYPYRAEHDGHTILAIRSYDPVTQRTNGEVASLVLGPASEVILDSGANHGAAMERFPGIEHRLPEFYPDLETVFDYWPAATLVVEARAEDRRQVVIEQIADAYDSRMSLRGGNGSAVAGGHGIAPERLYLSDAEWVDQLGRCPTTFITPPPPEEVKRSSVPVFAGQPNPKRALAEFAEVQRKARRKVLVTAATPKDLDRVRRRLGQLGITPQPVEGCQGVSSGREDGWFSLQVDLRQGFIDDEEAVAVVTASDLLGSRAGSSVGQEAASTVLPFETRFQIGDAVIHVDHGIGVLEGIETIDAGEAGTGDAVRLRYAGDGALMVPATEMDRIWRYGGASDAVSLDRLGAEAWPARRAKIYADLQETALHLRELVDERRAISLEPITPPTRSYERFVARFPFQETPDQAKAIEEVLTDLASGRPMDRLVCGDVGFGKTEVALRAVAAVALSGKQVAVVAPTTVLARQHLRTFQRRFKGLGIEIAHLSRLVTPSEARAVKQGLADGSVRVIVGTHAVAGKGVSFDNLGLVVIDEEQRFGTAQKAKLREMAAQGHILTLTATPIPRTLQAALVGLQDISSIATPPARRQPIRTILAPFDPASAREALLRERRRDGQSFVVCSRVEDIDPMRAQIATLAPELEILVAHGQMPAAEADDVMVRFADGEGDVLLATNIIESGLDVPRANTMLVWRADRFGLSQLHQLRGRVGRGRIRGVAYLLTEPERTLPRATEKRLRTLEALDRLGAGFAISAQDLDLRGAGALVGDEQAGHVKLIGADLYQNLLKRVLRGETPDEEWTPELNIGATGQIPEEYVQEPEVRINLYARLARLETEETVEDLAAEFEDRFGPPPEPVELLLNAATIRRRCLRLGIARIDAGPQAIALTLRPGAAERLDVGRAIEESHGEIRWSGERLVKAKSSNFAQERRELIVDFLERLS